MITFLGVIKKIFRKKIEKYTEIMKKEKTTNSIIKEEICFLRK
jgi:hypothetical protein